MDENQEAARLLIDLNEPEALLESLQPHMPGQGRQLRRGGPDPAGRSRTMAHSRMPLSPKP